MTKILSTIAEIAYVILATILTLILISPVLALAVMFTKIILVAAGVIDY